MNKDILIINNNLDTGGVEVVLQELVAYLCKKGKRVTVWASLGSRETFRRKYPASARFRKYPFWNVDCRRFSPKWFFTRFCRLLFEKILLRLKKWDVVLAFKEGEDMIMAGKLRARRKVGWMHTDYSDFHWTTYLFPDDEAERSLMAGFDAIAAVSAAAGKGLTDAIGDPGNLHIVYNPINYEAILRKARLETPTRPGGKTLLLSVGRLSEIKRYDMLIDICHELSADFPLELWIVGSGELEAELRAKLRRENISCVKLLGKKENPYPYIACADWLISSSASESFALTVQEALVLGTPVIASYCPAIAESMDSSFGIITENSRDALKAGIRDALTEPERAAACRGSIAEKYDKSELWQPRLEAIYRLIVTE